MIVEYHRPSTIAQALDLLSRADPKTYPLGGGSWLSRQKTDDFAVVDLQKLNLDEIEPWAGRLVLGATVRLQKLAESFSIPAWIKHTAMRETGRNLREMSTLAGSMVGADGRSPLAVALLAAEAQVFVQPGNVDVSFEDFLQNRGQIQQPWLITGFELDPAVDVKTDFIARSPADRPIVGVAIARWSTGRLRAAVGGFGEAPRLAYDGNDPAAAISAVEAACIDGDDEWASAEYRKDAAVKVAQRLLQS